MTPVVFLDAGPAGLVTKRPGKSPDVDACQLWLRTLLTNGRRVCLPQIADYEVRRELLRTVNTSGLARLDALRVSLDYLPITPEAIDRAAELWADARNRGVATADEKALDADVILVGQALTIGLPADEIIVATTNVRHIARYVPADVWQNITP